MLHHLKMFESYWNEEHNKNSLATPGKLPEEALKDYLNRNDFNVTKVTIGDKSEDGAVYVGKFVHVQVAYPGPGYSVVSEHPDGLKFGKEYKRASQMPDLLNDLKKALDDKSLGKYKNIANEKN